MKKSLHLSFYFAILAASIFAQNETEKGVELYRNGDYDSAISVLENVVKMDGKDRKAWTYLGASFVKKEKKKEALESFKTASSISVSKEEVANISEGMKITSKPRCNYTDSARQNGIQGSVSFAVEFKANGEIGFIFPIKTLSYGLTESCLDAIRNIRFEPARKNNKEVSMIQFLIYSFTLY
jgi:tetratricopeptide (TPR) repeat protein